MTEHDTMQLYQLIWYTRRLFQQLTTTSNEMLGEYGINTSQRAVLEFLTIKQPQTVPQMARGKSVSRQHIQTVINDLVSMGLVEIMDNPLHKRSSLVKLTDMGNDLFGKIKKRETAFLQTMSDMFSTEDIQITTRMLKTMDAYLQSQLKSHNLGKN